MVRACTDSVADIRFFLEFLSQLHTIECMRQFRFFIGHFTDIMQQTCTFCLLRVQAQFRCHHSTEIGCFTGVLQQVLTIRRAIFHLTDDTDQFRMQTVDTKVDCCPFTSFDDFFLYLFAYFGHHFLNTCRMDTSVCHQLVKSQTGNFTANRVKSGKNDCFRSVVYNDFNASSGLQCTDIASFTSDDTSFDFIRFDMEYRYGVFDGSFGSYPLDRLDNDSFGFLAGSQFRIIHDVIDE